MSYLKYIWSTFLFGTVFAVLGQSPGGVSNNLELWFKADAGVEESTGDAAEDTDPVEFWLDQSLNGFDAEQATVGERPLFDASTTINGNPTLLFDGNNDRFPINSLNYTSGTEPTAITIYSVLTTNNGAEGVIVSYDRNEYFRFATDHNNDGGFGLSTTNSGSTVDDFNASSNGIEADGIPHILGGRWDPSVSGTNKFLYFDGTVDNSTDAGTTAFGSGGTRYGFIGVGSEEDGSDGNFDDDIGPTNYLDGNLAEIIYYDAAISVTERQQIETYLAIKYGITLSGDTDGDATAFEAGEGDYLAADGVTVVWDGDANQTYHNSIGGIALDADAGLDQNSSQSINSSAILGITDAGLTENDYIIWGSNGASLGSSSSANSSFEYELNRVWKIEITGSTNDLDEIQIDLSDVGVLPDQSSDIALIIDDNQSFSSPLEVTSGLTFSNDTLTMSNVDFSSFSGDIFVTVAFNLTEPGGLSTNPAFWFRADAGVQEAAGDVAENGDNVQFWLDQSGNAYNGEQPAVTERPTFNSTSTINFNPVLTFNGSSSHLPIRDLNYDLTTNTLEGLTIFSIVKSSQTNEGIIVSYDRSSFFRLALNHNNTANPGLSTNVGTNIDDSNGATSAEDGLSHLVVADFSATSNTKNLFLDGSNDYTDASAHSPSGSLLGSSGEVPRFGFIGANSEAPTFNGSSSAYGFDGDIAEIIYYESVLSASDRLRIESYLAIKYGISLPGNYVSSSGGTVWDATTNSGYLNNIAGIAIDNGTLLNQPQSKSEGSGSVVTVSDAGLSDGEYVIWGHNGGSATTLITSGTGSFDARIARDWKVQITGATTNVDNISVDISAIPVLPSEDVNDYALLLDDASDFSSPTEVSPASLTSGELIFENLDISSDIYITLAVDPDLDGDGVADADDLDQDNDGIPNTDEGSATFVDSDGDGFYDFRDLDSDNDGIGDLYESGAEGSGTALTSLDTDDNGVIDLTVGTNGLADALETSADNGTLNFTVNDDDSDGVADFRDLDSDNSGLSDLAESGQSTGLDSDDNGVFDGGTDVDQDGISDEIDALVGTFGSSNLAPQNLDGTGDPDFRDLDNDDDGTEDVDELGLTDVSPDDGRLDGSTDADGDGVLTTDTRDSNDAVFGGIDLSSLQTGNGTDWYSYKSGDWNDPDNWTTDPSGTLRINPGSEYPNNVDENVTILNGDELTLNFDNLIVSSITINNGGIINLGTTVNHNFNSISGEGTIRLATNDFPGGVVTDFASVDGGTVEYVDQSPVSDYELTIDRTFNNLRVNASSSTVVLKSDYTLNGNLTVINGTFQINDNTSDSFNDNSSPLSLIVNGDLIVEASGAIAVGNVDASQEVGSSGIFTFHQLELLGDFTNDGSVSFTNLSPTSIADGRYRDKYPTASDADNNTGSNDIPVSEFGAVEVLLTNGTEDQLITMNGTTDFYRIEINKGSSQTFIAEFNASSTSNFRLLGRIAMNMSDDSDDTPNIANHRALGLEAGTLKLGDNIVINQISKDDANGSDPTTQGGNRNYIIDVDAQLWLASNSRLTKSNDWGIHPFGKLKISDNAILDFTGTGNRDILIDNQGVYEQSGGTVNTTQFRNKTGADGAPRGSFIMTGGTLNIGQGGADGNHAIFSIPWEDQNFILKASDPANPPEINITLDGNRGKDRAAVQIGVKEGNYDIGESSINIIHTSNQDYKFSSTAPLYDLTYTNTNSGELIFSDIEDANDDAPGGGGVLPDDNSGTTPSPAQFAQPLVLINDLIINDGRFDANDQDITIGNLMTIQDGGEYDPGANTTSFTGDSPIQRIRLNGATPLLGGGFNNLSFEGSGTEKEFEGDLVTVVIQGDLTIGSGVTIDDNGKTIQVNGNISNSGLHTTDVSSPGQIEITNGSAVHEIGGDGTGRFNILTIDDGSFGTSLTSDQQVDSVLNLQNGLLDASTNMITIRSTATDPIRDDIGGTGNFSSTRMIQLAANASDGGINYYFDGLTSDPGFVLYPIGTATGGVRYTPATVDLSNLTDDGFVQIRMVDDELQTVDLGELSSNLLTYYWRLSHEGFSSLPTVDSLTFIASDVDDPDGGSTPAGLPTDFVPGKVLDEDPFTRSQENTGDIAGFEIKFDGSGSGFIIENANYTAGDGTTNLFNGAPQIYYSADQSTQFPGRNWNATSTWSTVGHYSTTNTGTFPQDGDIVYIGFSPQTTDQSQRSHWVLLNVDANVAQIIFRGDSVQNASSDWITRNQSFTPQLTIDENRGAINLGIISGEGTFNVEVDCSVCNSDPDISVTQTANLTADFGDFAAIDDSRFDYDFEFGNNVSINLPTSFPNEYPNLHIKGGNGTERRLVIQEDILVRRDLVVRQSAILSLNDGAEGDIEVLDDLNMTVNGGDDEIEFPTSGNARTLTIHGDIQMEDGDNDVIEVLNSTPSGLTHTLRLGGSIDQQSGNTIDLFNGNSGDNNAILEFIGDIDGTYTRDDNPMDLFRMVMNKGSDQTSSFSFNDSFTLGGDASGLTKPVELQNGTLIFNDAAIAIDVNSGGSDFTIPATANLEIQSGTVNVSATGTGVGNGIRLNGKISIIGGDLILDGGASADNYIEYGSAGNSEIEITAGNLIVGSQLRRNLFSDDGVLSYTQTGGSAFFGVNLAPDDNRGVFEIINSGTPNSSSFTVSTGSEFVIVNGQASPDLGTFIIDDEVAVAVDSDVIIDFGYNGTVGGVLIQNDLNETYEINSAVSLPNIRIDNANFNSPVVELAIRPLIVSTNLEILNTGSLVANDFNLTVNAGFRNDGTYTPGSNTTIFNGGTQTLLGTTATTFNDLRINPTTSVTLSNSITINGDLEVVSGILNDDGNVINLEGDLTLVTEISSDGSGNGGLTLNNLTDPQEINLSDNNAEIDHLIIDNTEGVTLRDNSGAAVSLTIDQELELNDGVFKILDNRLVFDNNAQATSSSSFDATRMISLNGVKKSDGVEREFLASTNAPAFIIPVGTPGKYTPVTLDVDDSDDPGSVLVKPINAVHPSADPTLDGPVGELDVLNYYWVCSSSSVTNFQGEIVFQYEESDANSSEQNESSWTGVRLIAPNWSKPPGAAVDDAANTITFDQSDLSSGGVTTFDGEFTAGPDIPDQLAAYRSNTNGNWSTGANWDIENDGDGLYDDGNGVPQPGTIVIIQSGDEIAMNSISDNDQNIFSIQVDGVLDVSDSDGHNFGDVSGSGTIRIATSTLPGGNYDNFFQTSMGSLDLAGNTDYTISPDFANLRGLTISGGGVKSLPAIDLNIGVGGITVIESSTLNNTTNNNDINVSGDVVLTNGTFLVGNSSVALTAQDFVINSGTYTSTGAAMDFDGDITINNGTFNSGSGNINLRGDLTLEVAATYNNGGGEVIFDGTASQTLTGDFSSEVFNNIEVNKASGDLVLAASAVIYISNTLTLNGGNINTQASGAVLRLQNGVGSIIQSSGFVSGPLQVDLSDGNSFTFPVGKGSTEKTIQIDIQNSSQSTNPLTWEVEYYNSAADTYSSGENNGIDLEAIEVNSDTDEQVLTLNGGEFWRIETGSETAIASSITLDVSNSGATSDDINDQALQVMVWDNTGGEWDHLGGVSSGAPSSGNVVSTATLSFSEKIVTSGIESGSPLPVELLWLRGKEQNGVAHLKWKTAIEINNDHFLLEHSSDGLTWSKIDKISGSGNTSKPVVYEYIHQELVFGDNYYRLSQVDYDGRSAQLDVVRIEYSPTEEFLEVLIYPNPASSENVNLRVRTTDEENQMHVTVYDLMGNRFYQQTFDVFGLFDQNLGREMHLESGIFILEVRQGNNVRKEKLLIGN